MTPEKRAFEAKQIIENPVFAEALDSLRQATLDGLVTANIADVDSLRSRVAMYQACEEFHSTLKRKIVQGDLEEQIEVEAEKKPPWFARILSRQIPA